MLVAVLDVETTSLDVSTTLPTEVAAIVFCTQSQRIVRTFSTLIKHPNLYIPQTITDLTGISTKICEDYGVDVQWALGMVKTMVADCKFVVAHNAKAFDQPIVERFIDLGIPWIDSKTDIKYKSHITGKRLLHLAAEHGVQIRGGHEALNDCLMLIDVIKQYSFHDMLSIVEHRKNKICMT